MWGLEARKGLVSDGSCLGLFGVQYLVRGTDASKGMSSTHNPKAYVDVGPVRPKPSDHGVKPMGLRL